MSVKPTSSGTPTGKQEAVDEEFVVCQKHPEGTPRSDTLESAASESAPAAAKWIPPSCLARYCTYVKHRIADFFDWVSSLFCSSKPITEEELKAVGNEVMALSTKVNSQERLDKRYKGVTGSSKDDAYRYLADAIENIELAIKFASIIARWETYDKNNEVVLTERQLRSDQRQLIEIANDLGTFSYTDLPKKTTSAMIEKVKAYSLGKLKFTIEGRTISLIDMQISLGFPNELAEQVEKLIQEIRDPSLQKFAPQIASLAKTGYERYKNVTLHDLNDESGAVHFLADCIEVRGLCNALKAGKGDISKESLGKRVEMLKKRLDQPVLGTATSEMHKKVKEHDFNEDDIVRFVYQQTKWNGFIRDRLRGVINEIQKPKEAPNKTQK
jgi:hypothetical protein